MKAKLLILSAFASLSLAMPAIAKTRVVETTPDGRPIISSTGKHLRNYYRDSRASWGIGVGFGAPFYGGYYPYGGYPYGGYPFGGYPYGGYGGEYQYGGYRDEGYSGNIYRGRALGDRDAALVARVQQRLARAGIYRGPIDGVLGDRTRYAIRVYERIHGLPADGRIDPHLLATMGIS